MANRSRFNRENSSAQYDLYSLDDHTIDHEYAEAKARDIWTNLSDPPYIATGGNVSINGSNSQQVDVSAAVGFDKDFREVRAPQQLGKTLIDYTPGVINYLVLEYQLEEDPSSQRTTFSVNPTTESKEIYNSYIEDSYRYLWKLQAPINPEIQGLNNGPFDFTSDVDNRLLFSTDQSDPEYDITIAPTVASITGSDIGSGNITLSGGINDRFIFTVDTFNYDLDLTSLVTESFTLSGMATRINDRAFTQNLALADPVAFVIEGENKLRITSPRDATPTASKIVFINSGTANTTLGFELGQTSNELGSKSISDLADEINLLTDPEITAIAVGNKLKLQAQEPAGYIELQPVQHDSYDVLGLSTGRVDGALEIEFNQDLILAEVVADASGDLTISNSNRSPQIQLLQGKEGFSEVFTATGISGDIDIETSESFTLTGNTYVVGANELLVHVNGKYYHTGTGGGLTELGSAGTISSNFQVDPVTAGDIVEARVLSSSPINYPDQKIYSDSDLISFGFNGLNFGAEFGLTSSSDGTVTIRAQGISGAIMNHAFNHEFGGSDQINVNHLNGVLLEPQKTQYLAQGANLAVTTKLNIGGPGVQVDYNTSSGYVDLYFPETTFANSDGDSIIRLGLDGGTVYNQIYVSGDAKTWQITVDNTGVLVTEEVISGSTLNLILESPSGALYNVTAEEVFGSGELLTSQVLTGTALDLSLRAPNGKDWLLKVEDDGVLYTLDQDNIFQVQNDTGEGLFTIKEYGGIKPVIFDSDAVSGELEWRPPANLDNSGDIIFYKEANETTPKLQYSYASGWIDVFPTENLQNQIDTISGLATTKYVHSQTSGAVTWTVEHNLNDLYTTVTVWSYSGVVLTPSNIQRQTGDPSNVLEITFSSSTSGEAVIIA